MFEQAFRNVDDALRKKAVSATEIDHNKALTGDDLGDFVDGKLLMT